MNVLLPTGMIMLAFTAVWMVQYPQQLKEALLFQDKKAGKDTLGR